MRRETENVLKMWLNMSKSVEEWSCDIVMGYDKTSRTKPLLKVANIQQKGNETFEIMAKSHLLHIFNLQTADE